MLCEIDPLRSEKAALAAILDGEPLPGVAAVAGYASVWNVLCGEKKGERAVFAPGCFDLSLAKKPVVELLVSHDNKKRVLSEYTNRLIVKPDGFGLFVAIRLPDSPLGRDVAQGIRSGKRAAMSIAHTQGINRLAAPGVREYLSCDLLEVSICPQGNNPATAIRLTTNPGHAEREHQLSIEDTLAKADEALSLKGKCWEPSLVSDVQRVKRYRTLARLGAL